jgi:hypothetical protein
LTIEPRPAQASSGEAFNLVGVALRRSIRWAARSAFHLRNQGEIVGQDAGPGAVVTRTASVNAAADDQTGRKRRTDGRIISTLGRGLYSGLRRALQ